MFSAFLNNEKKQRCQDESAVQHIYSLSTQKKCHRVNHVFSLEKCGLAQNCQSNCITFRTLRMNSCSIYDTVLTNE